MNLYAGVGGNRKLWPHTVNVTAVENNKKIADVYRRLYPHDTVIEDDAHEYLRQNYMNFDFIWSSPPCQTHSKMAKATRHKLKRYPDLKLYEEILFLKHFAKCKWVVENVAPFYEPLIPGKRVGRHLFWSNFEFDVQDIERPAGFINKCNLAGKEEMMDWLGIWFKENIYYEKNHCPAQVLRNCVHPKIGEQIFLAAQSASA